MTEDTSVERTAFGQHTHDVAEPPKVAVLVLVQVVTSDEHAEAVVSTLEEKNKRLPVVGCVQVYDTEVAARRCCYSLPNIPLPSWLSSRKPPQKKKWSPEASVVAFNRGISKYQQQNPSVVLIFAV